MKKYDIMNACISGVAVSGRDVARVSRSGRYLTLRHTWNEDTDGRVLDGVRHAALNLAAQIAARSGRPVEIYARGGWVFDVLTP